MKFLRTTSTGRLAAMIAGLVIAIAGGTAIAVAATSNGPVPKAEPLAKAIHTAVSARSVTGISARIQFTNHLIESSDFTGDTANPLLQGATGRLWLGDHRLRLELQSQNGDAQVVVDHNSFWISDPSSQTVYEGTLPADKSKPDAASANGAPTLAQIQSELSRLMARVTVSGSGTAHPTDVAGRPAYSVSISPKHSGGLLGSLALAWDAVNGTPLDVAVYARGSSSPVLELKATDISYGSVSTSDFAVSPPAGDKVVKMSSSTSGASMRQGKHAAVHGVAAVAAAVPFKLAAPASLVGLARQSTTLLDWGGTPAAMVSYGRNLGGLVVIEQTAHGATASQSSGEGGLSLPSVSINGATAQELDTALGSVVRFTRNGVAYTLLGSMPPYAIDRAARGLTPAP